MATVLTIRSDGELHSPIHSPAHSNGEPLAASESDAGSDSEDESNGESQAVSNSDAGSDSEDDLRVFSSVLPCIKLDRLPEFCAKLRQQNEGIAPNEADAEQKPTVREKPLSGSFHILFHIDFPDGQHWLLKVPAWGAKEYVSEMNSNALTSEALTMKLLYRETSIPVPKVHAFDAAIDNELGCPFILMDFVDGLPLYDVWFDEKCSEDQRRKHRLQALEDIATAMAQLGRFSFDKDGAPVFDKDGNICDIGPYRTIDTKAMRLDALLHDFVNPSPWHQVEPETASEWSINPFEGEPEPEDHFDKGIRRLLVKLFEAIPQPEDPRKKFVLCHPDFDIQNFIVSEDGKLKAIIDWDDVATSSRGGGNEAYPGFLTRDWDPAMYGWKKEMEQGVKGQGLWEDSPSTLLQHRKDYEGFMRSALAAERQREIDLASGSKNDELRVAPPMRTTESLYKGNLLIAAGDTLCRYEILKLFLVLIADEVGGNRDGEYDLFNILNAFADDDLDEETADGLVKGLQSLFLSAERDITFYYTSGLSEWNKKKKKGAD